MQDIASHPVFLYMKGTPQQPMCGFSKRVVQILDSHGEHIEMVAPQLQSA